MFDLTKEIELSPAAQKTYLALRILTYLLFAAVAAYIFFILFFPIRNFYFSFRTAGALKNTILSPRDKNNNPLEKGLFKKENGLLFDTPLDGDYAKIDVTFFLEKNSPSAHNGTVSVRKSFQSFFYPEGKPLDFKEGCLVKNNGNYYIVSGGKFRKFSSTELLRAMNYNPNAFAEITNEDLLLNEMGDEIIISSKYPNSTLFKIENDYYQIAGNTLYKFVSEKAFLTKYDTSQTIEKEENFLKDFTLAENFFGFADGTLLSYGQSAYVVNKGEILPIAFEYDFRSMGYDWKDVIAANAEEIGVYKKGTLFTLNSPHPDGTIFSDPETKKYFYLQGGQKRELRGSNIQKSYLRRTPILAQATAMEIKKDCQLEKKFSFSKKYSCEIPIKDMQSFFGNDYQFELAAGDEIQIKEIKITFEQNTTWSNLRLAAADIKSKILLHYGIQK